MLADRLGSTIGLITSASSSIDRVYNYDPDGNSSSTGSGATTQIRYAGGNLVDGLYHFGARFYDPENARWTQQDPLTQSGDVRNANRYLYAGADPVNFVDLNGQGILDVLSWGSRIVGTACFIGAVVPNPAEPAFAACGIIAGTVGAAASAAEFAENPSVASGGGAINEFAEWGCEIGSIAADEASEGATSAAGPELCAGATNGLGYGFGLAG